MTRTRLSWNWYEIWKAACLVAGYIGLGIQFGWGVSTAFYLVNYGHKK